MAFAETWVPYSAHHRKYLTGSDWLSLPLVLGLLEEVLSLLQLEQQEELTQLSVECGTVWTWGQHRTCPCSETALLPLEMVGEQLRI